jgi:hypothetical protein
VPMRLDPRFLNWGVFFILLGAIPLAVSQGWIPASAIDNAWRFWPLILIGIGVGLLLRRTAFHFVGGLLVAATFGLMLGSVLAGGVNNKVGFGLACTSERSGSAFPDQAGVLGPAASVSLEMSCGDLTVNTTSPNGWSLSGSGPDGRLPRIEATTDRLSIESGDRSFFGSTGETWRVGLPTESRLDLSTTLNAGSSRLTLAGMHIGTMSGTTNAGSTVIDFTGATLGSLSYTVNAGSVGITLPAASLGGSASINAGSLNLCTPPGAGLRIESSSILASNNFAERGLVQTGSTWTSPGYTTATVRIDLSLSANAGSVELDPTGGCG